MRWFFNAGDQITMNFAQTLVVSPQDVAWSQFFSGIGQVRIGPVAGIPSSGPSPSNIIRGYWDLPGATSFATRQRIWKRQNYNSSGSAYDVNDIFIDGNVNTNNLNGSLGIPLISIFY